MLLITHPCYLVLTHDGSICRISHRYRLLYSATEPVNLAVELSFQFSGELMVQAEVDMRSIMHIRIIGQI